MKKFGYQHYLEHKQEHKNILQKIVEIDNKINNDKWNETEVEEFVDTWKLHIVDSDMPANNFMKQLYAC